MRNLLKLYHVFQIGVQVLSAIHITQPGYEIHIPGGQKHQMDTQKIHHMDNFFDQIIVPVPETNKPKIYQYISFDLVGALLIDKKQLSKQIYKRIAVPGSSIHNIFHDKKPECPRCEQYNEVVLKGYRKFQIKSEDMDLYKSLYPDVHNAVYTCNFCKRADENNNMDKDDDSETHNFSIASKYGIAFRQSGQKEPVFLFPCCGSKYPFQTWYKFLDECLKYELSANSPKSKYRFAKKNQTGINEQTAIQWIDIAHAALNELYLTINHGNKKNPSQIYYNNKQEIKAKVLQVYIKEPENVLNSLLFMIYLHTYELMPRLPYNKKH